MSETKHTPGQRHGSRPVSAARMIEANVSLTPEQVALAFWNLGSDGQVSFFAELDRLAGFQLCFQMAAVVQEMALNKTDEHNRAISAFRTMLAHAVEYANDANDWRCHAAKREIEAMVRDAKHRFANPYGARP